MVERCHAAMRVHAKWRYMSEYVFAHVSVCAHVSTKWVKHLLWIFVNTLDSRILLTCHFRVSLKHKDDGQTKFIKPNSQRQDIIIKYWVSIGSIHREQG